MELGNLQPTLGTSIDTYNFKAYYILTAQVHMKPSKVINISYHWIKYRIANGEFDLFSAHGKQNYVDYSTQLHQPIIN